MLSKFAIILANIFYNLKKRDTRLLHFWIILYKLYDIYLQIDSRLANTKLRHSANKFVVTSKFLKYLSLLVRQRQNVVLTTLG